MREMDGCFVVYEMDCCTYEWVMSHVWASHVTRVSESWHTHTCESLVNYCAKRMVVLSFMSWSVTYMSESCYTRGWVMLHLWVSHVTLMGESCYTYGWVMLHLWVSHVTSVMKHKSLANCCVKRIGVLSFMKWNVMQMGESCHTCGWVMSHMWVSHVTHVTCQLLCAAESCSFCHLCNKCHAYERVVSYTCVSHVTHMGESCHTYECVTWHIRLDNCCVERIVVLSFMKQNIAHISESCHMHEWVMSHIWVSQFTHMGESCHTYKWVMSHVWLVDCREKRMAVWALIKKDATHISESCHTHEWVMSHIWMSHVTHMSESCHTITCQYNVSIFICETWRIHTWDMTHSYVRHDSFIHMCTL